MRLFATTSAFLFACGLVAVVSVPVTAFAADDDDGRLAPYYGFLPVEVFKLASRSAHLTPGDFNHDGLMDVAVVDNSHSRVDLMLQQKSASARTKGRPSSDVNETLAPWRFEHEKLPVDHEIAGIVVGDYDGDGRTDLAFFGSPDQLIIRYQPESGAWTRKWSTRVPDVNPSNSILATGDLNNDQRLDLVILGKTETTIFLQGHEGKLASPTTLLNTSDQLGLAQITDIDGDGRADLCYLAGDGTTRRLCARLGRGDGTVGPEYSFDLERPRSVTLANIDNKPGQEIIAIDSRQGRVRLSKVEMQERALDTLPERLLQFGFGRPGSGRDRSTAVGDLDGDGLADVIVTDGEASRLLVFRQHAKFGLDLGSPFPSLRGADQVRVADLDGKGNPEVIVQSTSEKAIGISTFTEGRIPFPTLVPIEGEPLAIDVIKEDPQGQPALVVLEAVKQGKETTHQIRFFHWNAAANSVALAGSPVPVTLKGRLEQLTHSDLTGDGRPEILIFQGAGKFPLIISVDATGKGTEIPTSGPLGPGTVGAVSTSLLTLDRQSGLFVTQDNLARFVTLEPDQKTWKVVLQHSILESGTRLQGTALIELDGKEDPEVVIFDAGLKKLRVFQQAPGSLIPWKEVDTGEIQFRSFETADFNGDTRSDLLVIGTDKMEILFSGGSSPALKELGHFETQLEKTYPSDTVAGDFNHDGWTDIAILDTRSQYLEIVQYRPETGLEHALFFRLLEQKSFDNEEGGGGEPREGVAADFTGDGATDLLLLAYDRLLLYPQDTTAPAAAPPSPTTAIKTPSAPSPRPRR